MQAMKHMEPQVKQALEASKSASYISHIMTHPYLISVNSCILYMCGRLLVADTTEAASNQR